MLGRPVRPKPTPDGKAVLFLRARPRVAEAQPLRVRRGHRQDARAAHAGRAAQGRRGEADARRRRPAANGSASASAASPTSSSPTTAAHILLSLSGKLYLVSRADRQGDGAERPAPALLDPKFSPDGKSVAYVRDHDVYRLRPGRRARSAASPPAAREKKTHGLAEFVAQEEMAPLHRLLVVARRQVDRLRGEPTPTASRSGTSPTRCDPEQPPQPLFYPRPGKANVEVRLGIVPAAGGETVWIEWDAKKYPYLARVHWGKTRAADHPGADAHAGRDCSCCRSIRRRARRRRC